MKFDEVLDLLAEDRESVVRRFGGSLALIERFVRKFPDDKSYSQLCDAMASGDHHAVEVAAHTLKGVAGNLGFQQLFVSTDEMVTAVRQEQYNLLDGLFEKLKQDYAKIIGEIALID